MSFLGWKIPGRRTPGLEVIWFAGTPVAQEEWGKTTAGLLTYTDHLGTALLQMNGSGSVVWRAEYEPYGNVYAMRTGTKSDQPLRFPGQERLLDGSTGTEERYNINRWFRSSWGRFVEVDPLGVALSDLNPYTYVGGNPLTYKDPSGLVKIKQGYQRLGSMSGFGFGGEYSLAFGKAYTNGKCVGCTGGFKIELSLFYMHGYYCTGSGACAVELHHANIAAPFVAKAAQTFNKYEEKVYENKEECESSAKYFAEQLKKYMMNPNGWPSTIKEQYWKAQSDYEDTHHEGLCGWFSSLCAE